MYSLACVVADPHIPRYNAETEHVRFSSTREGGESKGGPYRPESSFDNMVGICLRKNTNTNLD